MPLHCLCIKMIYGLVCFGGSVCFLRLAANGIAEAETYLESVEEAEQKRQRDRIESGEIVVQAVK